MFKWVYRLLAVIAIVSTARASVVVELVPDNPGPYFGGESLTVDVWLHSQVDYDVGLRYIRFDFTKTDPALTLDPVFTFDFTSLADGGAGYQDFHLPELPIPLTLMSWDCHCPGQYLLLPASGLLHIGSLGMDLPSESGIYGANAVNAADEILGAEMLALPMPLLVPDETWRAFTGEITGGTYVFEVVPEPATIVLVGLATLTLGRGVRRRRKKLSHRHCVFRVGRSVRDRPRTGAPMLRGLCLIGISFAISTSASAQPLIIPSEKILVNIDSGIVSATGQGNDAVVLFSQVVSVSGAPWVRLLFGTVQLSESTIEGTQSFLRIVSLKDGHVQTLDSSALAVWRNSSAYFNGDSVLVELVGHSNASANRVVIDKILAGRAGARDVVRSFGTPCLGDDRIPSSDARAGRFLFYNAAEQYVARRFCSTASRIAC